MQCFGGILTGLKEAKVSTSYQSREKRRKENMRDPFESYVKLEFSYNLIRKTKWLLLAQCTRPKLQSMLAQEDPWVHLGSINLLGGSVVVCTGGSDQVITQDRLLPPLRLPATQCSSAPVSSVMIENTNTNTNATINQY